MNNDFVYDLETYPNIFTMAVMHVDAPFQWVFEISDWKNDSVRIVEFIDYLRFINARMVGFNNLGFDYPILHFLYRAKELRAIDLYRKAQAIIDAQDADKWAHQVYPSDRLVPQIDLYKIHHFDNKARATGLKALQFNMRSDSIEELPFAPGSMIEASQVDTLIRYNLHDVEETRKFYHHTASMIAFREELSKKYDRDFLNHNDTKIGKDYFIMQLEAAGVACYEFTQAGRTPRQTLRPQIALRDAILPWIEFKQPEFTRVRDWLKSQVITETKGVFKDLTATVNGFTFVFGLGGIHGSVENRVIEADDHTMIVDLDVTSYYPNLAIVNEFYPEHLGKTFSAIYKTLFEQRKSYPKKSAESAMLKLALNGVYGDSNNQFSPFYDPLFTMQITLNGQLLLCLLAERLMTIQGLRLVQVNTDGLTAHLPRSVKPQLDEIAAQWQRQTRLMLEEALYSRMFVRDVNNYLAVREDGEIKRKGAYEWKTQWHQDAGALVIPKIAEKVLIEGVSIRKTVTQWSDLMDFMLRAKVPRSSRLLIEYPSGETEQIQNTTRYYVAKGGGQLVKMMPPLKGKTEWRRIGVQSGWGVCVCNNLRDAGRLPVDFDYYIQEVEKLCLGLA